MTEAKLLARIRKACPAHARLFRNQVGALRDINGRLVTFGLCTGSSDLIGWTERNGVAVFTAIEVKGPKGYVSKEQLNFLNAVYDAGGIAIEARSVDDVMRELGR